MYLNSPAFDLLNQKQIPHQVFSSQRENKSIKEVAEERNQSISQIVRTLLFRLHPSKFVVTLIPGGTNVDWKKLRHILNTNRVTMATPEEVYAITGYKIGTVSPIGIKSNLIVFVDPAVFDNATISIGSGLDKTAIILESKYLKILLPDAIEIPLII